MPTITISDKVTISPVTTGVAQDFSKEVSYTVTAYDASTQAYTTKITVIAFVGVFPNKLQSKLLVKTLTIAK